MNKEDESVYELTQKIIQLCMYEKATPRITVAATGLAFISACDVAGISDELISMEIKKWRAKVQK